jgi:hypothetical protein
VTNELAASLIAVAWNYRRSDRRIPPHLIGELQDVASADTIAPRLRSDARRLLATEL